MFGGTGLWPVEALAQARGPCHKHKARTFTRGIRTDGGTGARVARQIVGIIALGLRGGRASMPQVCVDVRQGLRMRSTPGYRPAPLPGLKTTKEAPNGAAASSQG
ncbi:hypothetical protein VT84_24220 [Gemmata sp. SH-PL17]|nr:hypothetical protein VT84_24220 [Gemmata sp. SH-PL17]